MMSFVYPSVSANADQRQGGMVFSFDTGLRVLPRHSLTTQILGCVYLSILITGTILIAARYLLN